MYTKKLQKVKSEWLAVSLTVCLAAHRSVGSVCFSNWVYVKEIKSIFVNIIIIFLQHKIRFISCCCSKNLWTNSNFFPIFVRSENVECLKWAVESSRVLHSFYNISLQLASWLTVWLQETRLWVLLVLVVLAVR